MPINYARLLTGADRTAEANEHLGYALAFVAGATNAGGFLAVHQYTSHMTGIVSSMADGVVLGSMDVVLSGFGGLLSFVLGAMTSAMLINYARRRRLSSAYALPLLLEAVLLLCFGMAGGALQYLHAVFVPATVMLLCFIMGLQNAAISKISRSEIRTTHITGTITDIGIECGRLLYWNHPATQGPRVLANRRRLRLLVWLAISFFVGGLLGAVGFRHAGYLCTVPLAVMLLTLAAVPAFDDLRKVRGG
ncbi:DUF1275 domain-containing protein [Aquincola sp. S2]|uniref:DUF1275 domain-containing protein n=1 Tax=Pseudaquabacterium terrae TaxID=2732868 RepID=A0ABX2ER32_9BURK|nr:YoaK family protein [Aquabacterium terrae]NRF71002.1 DUF1275 domain-containing protein [Aquabacterium terrae]